MNVARNFIQAGAGGFLAGSFVGLGEALYLAGAAPDPWALPYAWALYGVLGLVFGLLAGAGISIAQRWVAVTESRGFAIGAVSAGGPLALAIGRYLANKVIYLERGVPLSGQFAILAVVVASVATTLVVVPILLRGPLAILLRGPGILGLWGIVKAGLFAFAWTTQPADPRDAWGKDRAATDSFHTLVILVDTLRADALGAYGGPVKTPNFDALAADGILFEQASANASWTRASGASILSSQLPSGHSAAQKSSVLPEEVVTWPEVLQRKGVTNGALVNNINLTSTFGFNQGFDSFVYESPDYPFGATESVFGLSMYKLLVKVVDRLNGEHKEVTAYYQPADVVFSDAHRFMDSQVGQWSLLLHLMEPHDPYFEHPSLSGGKDDYSGVGVGRAELERPDPSQRDHLRELYLGEVQFLDGKLGKFLGELKASGEYDNLLIILTADHGEEFMEHGGFWHGSSLYEEQLHVPLIVKLPKGKHAGTRVPWQVHSLDVGPTIVAQYGVAPHTSWQGRNLIPDVESWLTAGAVAPVPDENGIVEVPIVDPCTQTWPQARPAVAEQDFEGNALSAIRRDGAKYIRANAGNPRGLPESALFDLRKDPTEQHNLEQTGEPVCGTNPEVLKQRLVEELNLAIDLARSKGVNPENTKIDAAECERLKALGYVASDEPCGG